MGSHNAFEDCVSHLLRNIWDGGGLVFLQPLPSIMSMGIIADSGTAIQGRASSMELLYLVVC